MSVDRSEAPTPGAFWQKWYPQILLGLWVLVPEARRLVDWQIGYNSLPVIVLAPMVALLPLVGLCLARKRGLMSHDFLFSASLWVVAFGYAYMVGVLTGSLFGATYELALFALPLLAGVWIAGMSSALARHVFERFSSAALWLGAVASVYGILQFIAPPAWDVLWVQNAGLVSVGKPEPFGLRIFGTMNSPAVFADFLVMAILLNLRRIGFQKKWLIVPLLLCTAALALTLVRTAWLELAVGFAVYVICSPKRAVTLAAAGFTIVITLALAWNLSFITGNAASNTLVIDRISTLNEVQSDVSASDRVQESTGAIHESLAEPLGQGLGTVGTATKLSATGATTVLDNGYLMRFLEMGVFGLACYLLSLATSLILTISRLRVFYATRGDDATASLLATSVAIQAALIGAELSGDHHTALMAIVFWTTVGLSSTISKTAADPGFVEGFARASRRRLFPGGL
jgi:putative inorganic carbon (HCO3(-)) transporter